MRILGHSALKGYPSSSNRATLGNNVWDRVSTIYFTRIGNEIHNSDLTRCFGRDVSTSEIDGEGKVVLSVWKIEAGVIII